MLISFILFPLLWPVDVVERDGTRGQGTHSSFCSQASDRLFCWWFDSFPRFLKKYLLFCGLYDLKVASGILLIHINLLVCYRIGLMGSWASFLYWQFACHKTKICFRPLSAFFTLGSHGSRVSWWGHCGEPAACSEIAFTLKRRPEEEWGCIARPDMGQPAINKRLSEPWQALQTCH